MFQSTPPRGKRPARVSASEPGSARFQSTPPRGKRRRPERRRPERRQTVSIHAPAREATRSAILSTVRRFQSTPPRGKRHAPDVAMHLMPAFQSTPPRGKRRGLTDAVTERIAEVSIHAPAREATATHLVAPHHRQLVSIHAPAREATSAASSRGRNTCGSFNPRPRAGSDLTRDVDGRLGYRFNPRPRAGSDERKSPPLRASLLERVSIHAPAREATASATPRPPGADRFNPRPRAGSDSVGRTHTCEDDSFNPRPRAGSDPAVTSTSLTRPLGSSFNPRPRAGSDQRRLTFLQRRLLVSIHAPAREATPSS